ncbi:YitT family protein [Nocardioides sp. KC13]|uniref:YitT family protein n=1 Tax=Nocardioides turkmenicus TaxID=2711220 RepID=A0A6M1R3T6_9ACTN|nr:YitT family protein [Nocardioides sp. KC13]NGN92378.1 YitT family protein [Nocardioides sp. KC13]
MNVVSEPYADSLESIRVPHTVLEDALGYVTSIVVTSLGLYLIQSVGSVTGGTAGLSLLVSYWTGLPFEVLFVLVNLPFFGLALSKKGVWFTVRSLGCVIAVSVMTRVHADLLPLDGLDTIYGVIAGNLLVGLGLLVIFRHGASLGGFNVLALVLQERLDLRAGYVQMGLDLSVILLALAVVSPATVLLSALGAVILNIILAFNHRPGRYLA